MTDPRRLFSYKLTHDAGFTSSRLSGDPVGRERLIYLMQIQEILSFLSRPGRKTTRPVGNKRPHRDPLRILWPQRNRSSTWCSTADPTRATPLWLADPRSQEDRSLHPLC